MDCGEQTVLQADGKSQADSVQARRTNTQPGEQIRQTGGGTPRHDHRPTSTMPPSTGKAPAAYRCLCESPHDDAQGRLEEPVIPSCHRKALGSAFSHGSTERVDATAWSRAGSDRSIQWELRFPTNEWVAHARLSSGSVVSHDNTTVCRLASPSLWLKSTRSIRAKTGSAIRQSNRRLRLRTGRLCLTVGKVLVAAPRCVGTRASIEGRVNYPIGLNASLGSLYKYIPCRNSDLVQALECCGISRLREEKTNTFYSTTQKFPAQLENPDWLKVAALKPAGSEKRKYSYQRSCRERSCDN